MKPRTAVFPKPLASSDDEDGSAAARGGEATTTTRSWRGLLGDDAVEGRPPRGASATGEGPAARLLVVLVMMMAGDFRDAPGRRQSEDVGALDVAIAAVVDLVVVVIAVVARISLPSSSSSSLPGPVAGDTRDEILILSLPRFALDSPFLKAGEEGPASRREGRERGKKGDLLGRGGELG